MKIRNFRKFHYFTPHDYIWAFIAVFQISISLPTSRFKLLLQTIEHLGQVPQRIREEIFQYRESFDAHPYKISRHRRRDTTNIFAPHDFRPNNTTIAPYNRTSQPSILSGPITLHSIGPIPQCASQHLLTYDSTLKILNQAPA